MTARAVRAYDGESGAKVLGSQTDLLTPLYDGRAEIIPFRYLPVLLGGKGTSHIGWDTGDLPREKNCGYRTPPVPGFPETESESERARARARERERERAKFY